MSSDKRTDYGYAGMNREQAYRAYMGLTCNTPPYPPAERDDRIAVLREIMTENMQAQEQDVTEELLAGILADAGNKL